MSRRSKSRECRRTRTSVGERSGRAAAAGTGAIPASFPCRPAGRGGPADPRCGRAAHAAMCIASNLELLKIQENMDPFLRTSNNIATILNRMSQTPGIMCRMPPLPISLNEEHLNSLIQFSRRLFLWTILPRQAPLRSSAFLPQQWASFSFKSLNSIE
uniref:Uncharacterized protein n=1 Tax=Ananas comosus var. bracteatus TaxID=296719 RepID=A0A6V7QA89_ANACO|nr:unnamed protein product [Ananas comosus var. bracteatus]